MSDYQYKYFKEITIGNLSKEELLQKLSDSSVQLNPYAELLFNHNEFTPDSAIQKVKLVKTTLLKLGLEETNSNGN